MAAAGGRAGARAGEEALEARAWAAHRCEGVREVGNVGRRAMLRQGFALHEHWSEHRREVGTRMEYRPYDHGRGDAGARPMEGCAAKDLAASAVKGEWEWEAA